MKTFDEIREGIGVKVLRKGKEVKPTPKIGVKKIVKGKEVTEISKDMKGRYIKKAADDMAKSADKMARQTRKDDPKVMGRASARFVKRRKGIARAVEGNLYEMEMLTHKKKIAAAQKELNKAAAAHAKAADVHNDEAAKHSKIYIKAMRAKGHKGPVGLAVDPPPGGREHPSYHRGNAHKRYFRLHHDASQGNIAASHRAAMGADRHAQHVDDKHDKNAIKLHNNMVDAHHKLQAAKKASPLHKAKSAIHKLAKKVGVSEAKVNEISNKKLGQYFDKATAQRRKSIDYFDKSTAHTQRPATVKKHTDLLKRRHKGIGSVIKRDAASPGQKYITSPSRGDNIEKGVKGHSMSTKRADQLHKSYKNRKEDATDDAVKAFLKKGGKIKKLAPGKAAGYHGKDDPGSDVHGMMDRGDTKGMPRKKKIKSMGASPRGKREGVEEKFNFRVNVDGFPEMFMSGNSPGEVKTALRKLVKQPSMIKSVDRMTKHDLKKTRRKQAQVGEEYKYDYGTPESVKLMKKMTPGQNETKISELSKDTLQSYHKKSQDHMTTALKTNNPDMKKKFGKRLSGSGRAHQRLKKMGATEDAFTQKAVDGGKMKPPSKARLDAIAKQQADKKKADDDAIKRLRGENRRDRLRDKLAAIGKDMKKTNDGIKKAAGIEDKPKQRLGSDGKPFKPSIFKS